MAGSLLDHLMDDVIGGLLFCDSCPPAAGGVGREEDEEAPPLPSPAVNTGTLAASTGDSSGRQGGADVGQHSDGRDEDEGHAECWVQQPGPGSDAARALPEEASQLLEQEESRGAAQQHDTPPSPCSTDVVLSAAAVAEPLQQNGPDRVTAAATSDAVAS